MSRWWREGTLPAYGRKPKTLRALFGELLGHIMYSALVLIAILLAAWVIGFVIYLLGLMYPLRPDEEVLIHRIHYGAILLDAVVAIL